jgi:hypothetical protein
MYIVQTPKQVVLFLAGRVRRIYLNVAALAQSEAVMVRRIRRLLTRIGDTLVVDPIGFNDKTFRRQLPHAAHRRSSTSTERFKLINGGEYARSRIQGRGPLARSTRPGRHAQSPRS